MAKQIPIHKLRAIIRYDALSGTFVWNRSFPRSLTRRAGTKVTLYTTSTGYKQIEIDKADRYPAHRVAWALHHGRWPRNEIDHINRDKSDLRIANLRECSRSQNCMNRGPGRHRYKGIGYRSATGQWTAQIKVDGRSIHLGYFDRPIDAARAYDSVAVGFFGAFACLNFPGGV